jgi:tRNA threonylcarbamoyladenosine biosynthesis protein TsaB
LNIIAIDTSTETLGICLKTDKIIIRISQRANFKHAETLAPWIEKLCIEAEIRPKDFNLIVISIGPGSFTGLRIGIATAKGLAAGAECPVTGVSGLDASAWTHKYFSGTVIPVINAKKNRIYSAL